MEKSEYNKIAKFYDKVIGSSNDSVKYVVSKINSYNKTAKNILELGCGTGINLTVLSDNYDVTGIDLSEEMLRIAKKKNPNGEFYLYDIREFSINKKFDVILCLYDTINHIMLLNDWKKIFINAHHHLLENGLFIFDINTLNKLDNISSISPLVNKFDSNHLIIDVKKISRNIFNWNLKLFENKKENYFILHEANIKESSFEIERIAKELSRLFKIKKVEDENGKKVKSNTGRVYFVCQKI